MAGRTTSGSGNPISRGSLLSNSISTGSGVTALLQRTVTPQLSVNMFTGGEAANNSLARMDGTSGKIIKPTTVTIDDSNVLGNLSEKSYCE
jgi:hypothetical protein